MKSKFKKTEKIQKTKKKQPIHLFDIFEVRDENREETNFTIGLRWFWTASS